MKALLLSVVAALLTACGGGMDLEHYEVCNPDAADCPASVPGLITYRLEPSDTLIYSTDPDPSSVLRWAIQEGAAPFSVIR